MRAAPQSVRGSPIGDLLDEESFAMVFSGSDDEEDDDTVGGGGDGGDGGNQESFINDDGVIS